MTRVVRITGQAVSLSHLCNHAPAEGKPHEADDLCDSGQRLAGRRAFLHAVRPVSHAAAQSASAGINDLLATRSRVSAARAAVEGEGRTGSRRRAWRRRRVPSRVRPPGPADRRSIRRGVAPAPYRAAVHAASRRRPGISRSDAGGRVGVIGPVIVVQHAPGIEARWRHGYRGTAYGGFRHRWRAARGIHATVIACDAVMGCCLRFGLGALGAIYVGSRYYNALCVVDGPIGPGVRRATDDGLCELRMTEVPLENGGAEAVCVAYCPQ